MFNQIERASLLWVDEQIDILTNAQLLIENINLEYGILLQQFIQRLSACSVELQKKICKDHIFHNWVYDIKNELIKIYERGDVQSFKSDKLISLLNLLNFTISVLTNDVAEVSINISLFPKILFPASGYFFDLSFPIRNNMLVRAQYYPETFELVIKDKKYNLHSFSYVEHIKIVDSNFIFFLDPTGDEYIIDFDNEINKDEWIISLKKALDIIREDASSYDLIKNFVSYIVPLKQKEVIKNLSFSVRNLPNVIFKNNELTPFLIGETLVHEADHQFFYAVEKIDNFWLTDVNLQEPIYFSPWRDDPRPLDGILRGLSSFARVSRYYSTILSKFTFSEKQIESVGQMFLTRLTESEIALKIISQSMQLTEFGLNYLKEIEVTLIEAGRSAQNHLQYHRWREDAEKAAILHRNNWEMLNQKNG